MSCQAKSRKHSRQAKSPETQPSGEEQEIRMTNNFNDTVITEFRQNGGKVSGNFEGAPLLLLTTTGAKSGKQHTTPVMYLPEGDHWYVFASMAGAPTSPAWYHNLVAHPDVTVEVGTDKFEARATPVTDRAERDRIYAEQVSRFPQFGEYEQKTQRVIPVVKLERK
jgi:deazaflavin-dependent oxidoreductase (nitroreductase family)